ncbi:hypothetical protein AYL99_08442 [Fonsecaea erecta]|uniref:Protein kinase domain-containing protein n=1 Tax=Fonsecaea erecta TaxID=1367422 RepID=A0A178ZD25_9EURO|nr:hypothetical protein AYL99_08442 [Fonsecaea erecta]OAP57704.1 hypothetical protein AYL99_08442 [Fonsecaea erecta]
MVDPVGTPLAVLSTVELCIKHGNRLVDKYRAFKRADREILELILCVEDHWIKFEYQIQFLQSVWNSLDERLQLHQHHLLQHLHFKLQEANDLLDSTIGPQADKSSIDAVIRKKGGIRAWKYALTLEDCLSRSVKDLKKWHDMFDPSWFLITRVSSQTIDNQLRDRPTDDRSSLSTLKGLREVVKAAQSESVSGNSNSIWLTSDSLAYKRDEIPFSTAQVAETQADSQRVLVDTIALHPEADLNRTTKEVRDLARILSKSDPLVFGLLQCLGVTKRAGIPGSGQLETFELVFSIPSGLRDPTSLRTLLLQNEWDYSLNERLVLARSLASSVMYIHSSKFVHKNIRPETTIVFRRDDSPFAAPFLVGFEKFRPFDGHTFRQGDLCWEKNLYRHPLRQGLQPEDDYVMQHDIYSLGVMLLEIGLWTSLVQRHDDGLLVPSPVLDIGSVQAERNQRKKAAMVKRTLIDLASTRLASRMGNKFMSIALACLTCLDRTDNGFGDEDEFLDEDGIVVGVRYIEKVNNHGNSIHCTLG